MKKLTAFLLLFASINALAAGGGDGGIPWAVIGQQVFNLTIVIVVLSMLLKKKIKEHFIERKAQFAQLVEKAEEAKTVAENSKREITERLQQLQTSAESDISRAKSEADELKHKILAEAESLSQRLKEEAKSTAAFEVERAKLALRKALLDESFILAEKKIQSEVTEEKQTQLKSEFIDKIQVVQ